jgi:UDP-N-acetylglucosamine--N-acetylmuramyl-(pentapeptide) pyrophosphoryl-undecaprenol N-acetylglucosamine transferase
MSQQPDGHAMAEQAAAPARGAMVRVVISGGGTGGHLFPALAVRAALQIRRPTAEVLFVGAATGVEATILPRLGHAFHGLSVRQVKGAGWRQKSAAILILPRAVGEAARLLKGFDAGVVLGVGGYASFPTVLAARLTGIPAVLHEQNAYPGLANRWLGRLATSVAVSFEASAKFFPARKVAVTGNPVRPEIRPGDAGEARRRLGLVPEPFTVLTFGGSQGAHRLNLALREGLPLLVAMRDKLQFLHATGGPDLEEVRAAYAADGFAARVEPFFDGMATAYQAADFVICRAGASTLFELAALGKPALLVPYPYAANDHQRRNAEHLVTAGAAWLLLDQYCDGRRLAAAVQAALEKPALLAQMGGAARKLARPDAAERIVDLLEDARAGGRK